MARKDRSDAQQEGRNELLGVILLALALFLFLALFSYDRRDLDFNRAPANENIHNLIGRVGARTAWILFFTTGAAAYVLPVIFLGFGLAALVPGLGHLHRNWRAWLGATGFLVACVGLLDLYSHSLGFVRVSLDSIGPGGLIGKTLNQYGPEYLFNRVGASILYGALYFASLWFFTGFHFWSWLKSLLARRQASAESQFAEPIDLGKKTRELEKKARKLQEKIDAAEASEESETDAIGSEDSARESLGADLQPVPEPTFRDNSLSRSRAPSGQPVLEGQTIPASEIASANPFSKPEPAKPGRKGAATTAEILGRNGPGPDSGTPSGDEESIPSSSAAGEKSDPPPGGPTEMPPGGFPPSARVRLQQQKRKPIAVASTPMIGDYRLPGLDLLNHPDLSIKPTETREELMANSRLMVQTLAQFGIEVAPGDITRGPTITRYELHPAPGVKLEKIAALTNNMAAALKAERINILAPVPGKSSVGVEVPNAVKTKVIFRDMMESPEWQNSKARIPLCLGKDVYGHPIIADLAEMPHCLIAGSTGSGKSVCINSIIASLLYKFRPDELRFVMIDPKVVELQQYNALPHLVVPVVNDPKKVILALRWVVNEMEKRYQIFAKVNVRNIKSFNERPKDKPLPPAEPELPLMAKKERVEPGADGFAVEVDEQIVVPRDDDIIIPEKLSYIVVIIDELADLMLVAPADVEMAIARITQMARAAGIHCIVATQRPSVDVITGVIKANIPARIAFQVAAKVDSRTILDQMGADKLLGKGDMLYLPPGSAKLNRAQGVLITDQEIELIVGHIARQGKPSYEVEIHQALQKTPSSAGQMSFGGSDETSDEDQELIEKCIEIIRSEKKASVSLLQRRLKLGYGRASRIMDELEERGIVGPSKGAEPRDILLDLDGQGYDGGGQTMV